MRVDAELEHHHVGLEGAEERRHHGLEGGLIHVVVGEGLQRQVDREAHALALAHLHDEARPREEPVAALVRGDREHARIAVEGELHAVAVMRVDVHVGDAPAAFAQPHDCQHRVIDVAEAGGAVGHGMVQPAGEVKGAISLALGNQLRRQERPAGHELGGLPEPREDRVVPRPQTMARGMGHPVPRAHGSQDLDVVAVVKAGDGIQ